MHTKYITFSCVSLGARLYGGCGPNGSGVLPKYISLPHRRSDSWRVYSIHCNALCSCLTKRSLFVSLWFYRPKHTYIKIKVFLCVRHDGSTSITISHLFLLILIANRFFSKTIQRFNILYHFLSYSFTNVEFSWKRYSKLNRK